MESDSMTNTATADIRVDNFDDARKKAVSRTDKASGFHSQKPTHFLSLTLLHLRLERFADLRLIRLEDKHTVFGHQTSG